MKWCFHSSKFDESLSSSLMSRSQWVWWNISSSLITSHHERRSITRKRAYVARQIENEHTSLDNQEWAYVTRQKMKLDSQETDDEMIKHDHENELFQNKSQQEINLNRIFQITFHILKQNVKHVINILSQQFVSILTAANKFSSKRVH
jgi:hypothetical protein